jgi:uncharacterized protein (TIGR02246 family)
MLSMIPIVQYLTITVLALGLLQPVPAVAQSQGTCTPATKEQIAELSDNWAKALAAGRAEDVAAFYAEEAVLLPMLSMEPRMGRAAIKSYFDSYVKRHPQGAINMRSIMVGCNVASDIGTYLYRLTGQRKGTREAIGGRYSTVYEYREGKWLIVQQHTSTMLSMAVPNRP